MSRSTSSAFKQAAFKSQTDECIILLLDIDHDDLEEPIRVGSDGVDTEHNGNSYIAFPFEIILPDDRDDQLTSAKLVIDNVDRRIVKAVRSISGPPTVELRIVLASDPDTVEAGPLEFELTNCSWDALTVEGELGYSVEIMGRKYPAHSITPQYFPGLFR